MKNYTTKLFFKLNNFVLNKKNSIKKCSSFLMLLLFIPLITAHRLQADESRLLSLQETYNTAKKHSWHQIFYSVEDCARALLIEAATTGRIDVIEELVYQEDIDVNLQHEPRVTEYNFNENKGATALTAAAEAGQEEVVKLLIKLNANLNAQTNLQPLSYSGFNTPLTLAAQNKHCKIVGLLINANADINNPNNVRNQNAIIDCLYQLIDDEDFDLDRPLFNSQSLLMIATAQNRIDIVKKLIKKEVNLNHQDDNGYTALMIAAENNYYDILLRLIKSNADLNIRNKNDQSATTLAFYNNHIYCLYALLSNNAFLSINNLYELQDFEDTKIYSSNNNISQNLLLANLPLSSELIDAIITNEIDEVKELTQSYIPYWGNCTPNKECALLLATIYERSEILDYLRELWKTPNDQSSLELSLRTIFDWICFLEPTNLGSYLKHNASL